MVFPLKQMGKCWRILSCGATWSYSHWTGLHACVCAKLLWWCPTLCKSMDCSPPGSSVHRILQSRILEWVAMPSSRGSSQPRDRTCISWVSCIGDICIHIGMGPGTEQELNMFLFFKLVLLAKFNYPLLTLISPSSHHTRLVNSMFPKHSVLAYWIFNTHVLN